MFYVLLECAGILGDALCYDTLTNTWTAAEAENALPRARNAHTLVPISQVVKPY